MNEFYDTPCELCGEGILRTGKRGRPPKKHLNNCPTPEAARNIKAAQADDNDAPVDPEVKAVEEFEKTPAPKGRSVLVGMPKDRMQRRTTLLKKGDTVFLGKRKLILAADPVDDGPTHVKIKFRGHDNIRVAKVGMAWIPYDA